MCSINKVLVPQLFCQCHYGVSWLFTKTGGLHCSLSDLTAVWTRWYRSAMSLNTEAGLAFSRSEIEPLIYNLRQITTCQYNSVLYLQRCPSRQSCPWRFLCRGVLYQSASPQLTGPQEAPEAPLPHKELRYWARLLLRPWKVPKH